LGRLPDRRTFDRRLKAFHEEFSRRVVFMGGLLCLLGVVDPSVTATDSTLIEAWKGRVWHERQREQGLVPCSLDVEARWGKGRVKGWVYGWKGYVASSTTPIPVPLYASLTGANAPDNSLYPDALNGLPEGVSINVADAGHDDRRLHALSHARGVRLLASLRGRVRSADRLRAQVLLRSEEGRALQRLRSTTVEPLIGQMKGLFKLDPMPAKGRSGASSLWLLGNLTYQLCVLHNHLEGRPLRHIKHMLRN